ncbi:MAG: pirin family protein [Actinomycetota bacterium]
MQTSTTHPAEIPTGTATEAGTATGTVATVRTVERIVTAVTTLEGGGFEVHRPFPTPKLDWLDPFLLLDEMAPTTYAPGEAVGAPAHPHRGFETVTYILRGEAEHRDSMGNHGVIGPGDVQWMTAGDGIIHSEMPSERVQAEGGVGHGIQLWVNLPASLRRTAPAYQSIPTATIPEASGVGWTARVIAGEFRGIQGPARTHTPVGIAHVTIEPGTRLDVPVVGTHTAALHVLHGKARLGGRHVVAQQLAVFARDGDGISIEVPAGAARAFDALVLTGEPIGEPIARYGPFVMNTDAEIAEALADFQAGRLGTIPATGAA